MARLFAVIFFLSGVARIWFDWQLTTAQAKPFRFADIATVWSEIHPSSLEILQAIVERYLSAATWETMVSPPLAPVLFGLAFVFWVLRKRKKR
ncbi:MAG: hypothetical protein V3V13_05145 [Paracoccaceae bacterium]